MVGKNLKWACLELGGNDPFIVLEDADIDLAVKLGIQSWLANSGQTCINAKRFIIDSKVYDEFSSKLKEQLRQVKIGNPLLETTQVGPLANCHQVKWLYD